MIRLAAMMLSASALTATQPALANPINESAGAENSMQAQAEYPPFFAEEMARSVQFVEEMMEAGINVPEPVDQGGGYTHEQHKRNYRAMYLGGHLYRLTGEQKYADFVRDMLLEYADLYPTLGDHPARSNQNSGRLFWQVLNDAVWLVNSVQGYEQIRDTLDAATRERIDTEVFRRAAHFLSVDSSRTFNLIHNHATWATAGVGMTGYVLGDDDLVEHALMGSNRDGATGFLRQTELLFSPDGYYTEGPYYQRYALMPFMVFAGAIARNEPERDIFGHRDGILRKALLSTIQQTYDGRFFPFNDALKDKSLRTEELYQGVAIGYAITGDPTLLDIARWQGRTVISPEGLELSRALAAGEAEEFPFRSLLLSDGPEGDQGAVAILRSGAQPGHMALVAKNTSQGMGHGHFDKLTWQLYANGHEILRDYGAARFLNIEAKAGGRYLPENESWAKQTIAHNTLALDETSHFGGDVDIAEQIAPRQVMFSDTPGLQASSALIAGAYADTTMRRTLVMAEIPGLQFPIVVDFMSADAAASHQYDLPVHYTGHLMETGFESTSYTQARPVLGEDEGYQHIWVDARARPQPGEGFLTWLFDNRFYTYRFATDGQTEIILGETGASDPSFNLRREPLAILRREGTGGVRFASVLEPHGLFDGATEQTVASRSRIANLQHGADGTHEAVIVTLLDGHQFAVAVSPESADGSPHSLVIDGREIRWTGKLALLDLGGASE